MKLKNVLKVLGFIILTITSLPSSAQKVGFLMDSYITDRWYMDQKLFVNKVIELGGECQVEVAYGDPAEQIRLAKKMIADGVDVLVVVPADAQKAIEIVDAAKASNIPLVCYDRLIPSPNATLYISYNNERIGELQAEYALSKVPKGNYLLINGPVSDNNGILYRKGQLNILKPHADKGEIKIIADWVMSDWGEIGVIMKMEDFLSSQKVKPDVIVAANDALANASIQTLPPDLLGKVVITGQDADLTGMRNIIAGNQSMTIYKPIKPVAELAAEMAIKLAKGETVHGKIQLQNGNFTVEAILLDPIIVDQTNYKETVVKDGHASLSDLSNKKQ